MKCANCANQASYEYRVTTKKSVFYCGKDLPKFLEERKKAGLLKITPEFTAQMMAINPRSILGIEIPVITEGGSANFTVFNPSEKYVFNKSDLRSKSRNTPFIETEFEGKVKMTFNKHVLYDNLD